MFKKIIKTLGLGLIAVQSVFGSSPRINPEQYNKTYHNETFSEAEILHAIDIVQQIYRLISAFASKQENVPQMAQEVFDELKYLEKITYEDIESEIVELKKLHKRAQPFEFSVYHRPAIISALKKYDERVVRYVYGKVNAFSKVSTHTSQLLEHTLEKVHELDTLSHNNIDKILEGIRYEYAFSDRKHYYNLHDPGLIKVFDKYDFDLIMYFYKKSEDMKTKSENVELVMNNLLEEAVKIEKLNEKIKEEIVVEYKRKFIYADGHDNNVRDVPAIVQQMYRHNKELVKRIYHVCHAKRNGDSHTIHMMAQVLERLELRKDKGH